jgi:hypothetical protein
MLGIKLAERTKNSQFLPIRPPRPATPFGPDPRRSRTWARRAERLGRRFAFAPGIPQRGAQEALPRQRTRWRELRHRSAQLQGSQLHRWFTGFGPTAFAPRPELHAAYGYRAHPGSD